MNTLESPSASLPEPLRLRAEVLDGARCRTLAPEEAIKEILQGTSTVWLDILVSDPKAAWRLLHDELGFHELAVEDALSDLERPTLQEFGDVVFLSIPAPVRRDSKLDTAEIGIFLLNHAVVTVSLTPLPVIDTWFHRWREHPTRIGNHPAHVMYVVLDAVVDSYFPIIDAIEDEADDLVEAIFGGQTENLPEILRIKRNLLEIRRAVSPLRDVVNSLLRRDLERIPPDAQPYFQDVFDHVLRISEMIDTNRESLNGLLDIHLSTTSNSLNQVMKKMTVLSTVLMSMALIAGIYGMNFDRMPELRWAYGYPFALGLMLGAGVLIVYIFRRVKWL
ncbi:MAG: magnesium/cobalt transporter CorA [Fimbriimonas sp.]